MTFTPTFQMVEISQRITDGDVMAVRELWPLIFPDVPFDATRPIEDIAKDIAAEFEKYNEEAAKRNAPEPEPEYSDGLTLLVGALVIVGVIMSRRRGR